MIEYYYEGFTIPLILYFTILFIGVGVSVWKDKDYIKEVFLFVLAAFAPKFGYLFAAIYYL